MALCSGGDFWPKRFLYEARPDLIPWGYLTEVEIGLWIRWGEQVKSMRKRAERMPG